jgi:DNA-directed RNA polymerase I subunit RPA49
MDPPPAKKSKLNEAGDSRVTAMGQAHPAGLRFTCRVKAPQPDEMVPFAMSFPQGPPPTGVLNNGEKGLAFQVYKPQEEKKATGRMDIRGIAPDFPVRYTGSVQKSSQTEASYKYCIGAFNCKTNTVQLIPTPGLFAMTQSVEGQGSEVSERKYADMDFVAQRQMLINTFASNRRRRMLTTMVANRVNDQTSFGVEVVQIAAPSTVNPDARPDLPHFDAAATTADAIYPLTSLAPIDELDFLIMTPSPCVKALEDPEEASSLRSSLPSSAGFILQSLISAVNATRATATGLTTEQHQRRAALLQYLVYLMVIYKMQESNHHKIIRPVAEKQIPSTVLDGILARFASSVPGDKKKFITSGSEVSKLLNYIAIIALTLNNFSIPVNPLAEDLSLTPSQLRMHFELAGCKVTLPERKNHGEDGPAPSTTMSAKLSAPLILPDQAKRPSKRGKR